MVFQETPVFTKLIRAFMDDETYRALQHHLVACPDAGVVIEGTSGLRKLRWRLPGTGKRGGVRVIYYWRVAEAQILMLFAYAKSSQPDLIAEQKRLLRRIVETW